MRVLPAQRGGLRDLKALCPLHVCTCFVCLLACIQCMCVSDRGVCVCVEVSMARIYCVMWAASLLEVGV